MSFYLLQFFGRGGGEQIFFVCGRQHFCSSALIGRKVWDRDLWALFWVINKNTRRDRGFMCGYNWEIAQIVEIGLKNYLRVEMDTFFPFQLFGLVWLYLPTFSLFPTKHLSFNARDVLILDYTLSLDVFLCAFNEDDVLSLDFSSDWFLKILLIYCLPLLYLVLVFFCSIASVVPFIWVNDSW